MKWRRNTRFVSRQRIFYDDSILHTSSICFCNSVLLFIKSIIMFLMVFILIVVHFSLCLDKLEVCLKNLPHTQVDLFSAFSGIFSLAFLCFSVNKCFEKLLFLEHLKTQISQKYLSAFSGIFLLAIISIYNANKKMPK